jgi:hypothetical protein
LRCDFACISRLHGVHLLGQDAFYEQSTSINFSQSGHLPGFFIKNSLESTVKQASDVYWTRDGKDWVLKLGRRKLGRVFPDDRYPGMWRSRRADGRLSDMANLSWAKHAVLAAAERDISCVETPAKRTFFEDAIVAH